MNTTKQITIVEFADEYSGMRFYEATTAKPLTALKRYLSEHNIESENDDIEHDNTGVWIDSIVSAYTTHIEN
jgi:hypothetical protein